MHLGLQGALPSGGFWFDLGYKLKKNFFYYLPVWQNYAGHI